MQMQMQMQESRGEAQTVRHGVNGERLTMDDGRWTMDDGRQHYASGFAGDAPLQAEPKVPALLGWAGREHASSASRMNSTQYYFVGSSAPSWGQPSASRSPDEHAQGPHAFQTPASR